MQGKILTQILSKFMNKKMLNAFLVQLQCDLSGLSNLVLSNFFFKKTNMFKCKMTLMLVINRNAPIPRCFDCHDTKQTHETFLYKNGKIVYCHMHCISQEIFIILDKHFHMWGDCFANINPHIIHQNVWLQELSQLTCTKFLIEAKQFSKTLQFYCLIVSLHLNVNILDYHYHYQYNFVPYSGTKCSGKCFTVLP